MSDDPGSVFADRGALADRVVDPERDAVVAELAATFSTATPSDGAAGVLVYDPSGPPLAGPLDGTLPDTAVVGVTASGTQSAYDVGTALATELGAEIATSGLAFETVRDALANAIDERDRPVIVAVERIDALRTPVRRTVVTDLLDTIPADGVVAVSTDLSLRNDLAATEKGVLCDRELPVAESDPETRRRVAQELVGTAFHDAAEGVVSAAVEAHRGAELDLASLLLAAGERADREQAERVRPVHVRTAAEAMVADRLGERVEALSGHERATLAGLVARADAGALPTRFGPLYDAYAAACDRRGLDPNTERSVQNYCSALVAAGLAESEQVRTDGGGQFYRYDLCDDPALVERALDSVASE